MFACVLACALACNDSSKAGDDAAVVVGTDVAQTGGDKPASLPTFAELELYSSASPFNQKIAATAKVDANSDAYVAKFAQAAPLLLNLRQYSATVFVADADTPRYNLPVHCGAAWEIGVNTLLNVPIPTWAEPSADDPQESPPVGCGEASGQDNNMVILDLVNRCEYNMWQVRIEDGRWVASWANAIGMDSNGVFPAGMSGRGSGFAFLGGFIWPDEVTAAGQIEHALTFAYPYTRAGGPVPPATDSDGEVEADDALPEGAHLRLNPSLELDTLALSLVELKIARALQVYGMYLVDNGGESGIGLYAVDPRSTASDPYKGLFGDEIYPLLENIPLDQFQVLELPSQVSDWRDRLALADTGCNAFE